MTTNGNTGQNPEPIPASRATIPIPPSALQYHVFSRQVSTEEFLEAGRLCAESLEKALSLNGFSTRQLRRVLDFGCGCARVLRHFVPLFEQIEFHGTDVAPSVIEWDQEHVPGMRFHQNGAEPPLPFTDGFFDYLWSISVFSHLPEQMASAWIGELRRVLRPGGVALVTVHGPFRFEEDRARGEVSSHAVAEYERDGFTYVQAFADELLPDWYQNAYMCESFARRFFSRDFDVLAYSPRGMMGRQDIVLLQRLRTAEQE